MTEKKKQKYIQSSAYAIVGETGSTSADLAPGERVAVNEDAASHKYLVEQIEAGNPAYAHLSLVEVDYEQDAKRAEEEAEMAEKARKIAAEARNEEARATLEREEKSAEAREGQGDAQSVTAGTDFPPQDLEAIELAKQSGSGQGRRSSSSKKG